MNNYIPMRGQRSIEVDGKILNLGDEIYFKEDYERFGTIVGIENPYIDIEYGCEKGECSELVTKHVDKCWVE